MCLLALLLLVGIEKEGLKIGQIHISLNLRLIKNTKTVLPILFPEFFTQKMHVAKTRSLSFKLHLFTFWLKINVMGFIFFEKYVRTGKLNWSMNNPVDKCVNHVNIFPIPCIVFCECFAKSILHSINISRTIFWWKLFSVKYLSHR